MQCSADQFSPKAFRGFLSKAVFVGSIGLGRERERVGGERERERGEKGAKGNINN